MNRLRLTKIKAIPSELLDEGYKFISFNVTSLCTNVPSKLTYENKVIRITLRTCTKKKLIIDACTKTAFSFSNKTFKHIDWVMKSSLGLVLADIIVTELEKIIVKVLFDKSLLKLDLWHVDDTFALIKKKDVKLIHGHLHSFDKNIKFAVDTFTDGNIHFLDI